MPKRAKPKKKYSGVWKDEDVETAEDSIANRIADYVDARGLEDIIKYGLIDLADAIRSGAWKE